MSIARTRAASPETPTRDPTFAESGPPIVWARTLTTRSGYVFQVRSADPADAPALAMFFTHVTPDDLRFRFLSASRHVGADQIARMTHVDHLGTEDFLAFDPERGTLVATAMMVSDATFETAEVAIAIHADFKHRGIGWTLLDHVTRFAKSRGIRTLQSVESRDNYQAIELEREMGFSVVSCPGDPGAVIVSAALVAAEID